MEITLVRQGYESIEGQHNYKIGTETIYRGQHSRYTHMGMN